MNKILKISIIVFSLIFLYGFYYFGIPAIVNNPKQFKYVENLLQKEYGYNIAFTNPQIKMGYLPSIWFKADNFSILNKDNSKALSIDKPVSKIRLLPLIINKAEICHFSASNLDAELIFDKNSLLKLGDYPLVAISKSKITVEKAAVKLGHYKINLLDEQLSKNIRLDGKYFTLYDFIDGKRLKFATDTDLFVGEKASKIEADIDIKLPLNKLSEDQFQVNGKITNLNLADFSNYASAFSKKQIKSLSGILNAQFNTTTTSDNHKQIITNIILDNFAIMEDEIAKSIYCKDTLKISSDLNTFRNGIKINEMAIQTKGIDALVKGKISRLNAKTPNLDLIVSLYNSKTENIIPLLPGKADLSEDVNLYLLKKYGFFGDIVGNLEITGKADKPSLLGNILVTNGYLIKPIPNNTPKATIKLAFLGEKLNLDINVPTGETENVFVKGPVALYGDKYAKLSITSTKNVDLKTAQNVLNPLHEILRFELGPVPAMDLRGQGSINLRVTGNPRNPHGWGEFSFKNTTASFLQIHNMTLKNGVGKLTFDDQNTHFLTEKAFLNNQPLKIDGTCTLLGVLDFKVITSNQNANDLIKIVNTSPMLKDIQKLLEPVKSVSGPANFGINLTGQVKDVNDAVFNKNIFAKGQIELFSNKIELKDSPIALSFVNGLVKFNNLDVDFDLFSTMGKSEIKASGKIKNDECDTKVISSRFNLADAAKLIEDNVKLPYKKALSTINTSFTAEYKGRVDKIDPSKLNLKGKIYSNRGSKSPIIVSNGTFELNNSNFKLSPLQGTFNNSPYSLSANILNVLDESRVVSGDFSIKQLDLGMLNNLISQKVLPADIQNKLKDIKELKGIININGNVRRNNYNAYTQLNDISLIYVPKNAKIKILSGNSALRNDVLSLNKINSYLGEMPMLIDGKISDIYRTPNMNIYINAKPTQEFLDQFFNNQAVYPIKLKGDVICSSRILGTKNNFNAKSELKIEENSSIYYMGASLGDASNPVRITLDNNYSPKRLRLNNFKYDKIISSQNNKQFANTQLQASGIIDFLSNNNLAFHNLRIKTDNPTDAKIFNIIFRKPIMKQGLFTSDLVINGTSLNPDVIGKLDVTSIDMPFLDSTIKDVNLDFKNDNVYMTAKGVVLTNTLNFSAVMKNKLTPPLVFHNVKLKLEDLDINKITDMIRDYETDMYRNQTTSSSASQNDYLSKIIINKAEVEANTIKVRNINAKDFTAQMSLNEKMLLDVNKFRFKIAEGSVNGAFKYSFIDNGISLVAHMKDSNAQIMSEALFDLHNQVYGNVTGDVALACNGRSHEICSRSLFGNGYFEVAHGKLPKLGSLEYLLKAGNLVSKGITGLSINGIIDLITPLKTGEFESINGNVVISNGVARQINIYSKGKDLNMYLTGNYSFATALADMQIFGSLSKNMSNVFGRVGNASLNTLLNTIPWVNAPEIDPKVADEIDKIPNIDRRNNIYRIFTVDINGDINGTDYVKSFKWVK